MSNKTRNERHRLLLQDYPADDTVDLQLTVASGGNVTQAITPLWPSEANLGGSITATGVVGFSHQSLAFVNNGTEPIGYTYVNDAGDPSTSDYAQFYFESDNGRTRVVNFLITVTP